MSAIAAAVASEPVRNLSSIFLKTFALRFAVIVAYGHLASLQRIPERSSVLLPRILLVIFAPPVTLMAFFLGYLRCIQCTMFEWRWSQSRELQVISSCSNDDDKCGLTVPVNLIGRNPERMQWSLRFSLMVAAGLYIERPESCPRGECTADSMISIAQVPLMAIEYHKEPWTFETFLLRFSRVFVLLGFLAQSVASLALINRRRQVEGATLLVDSRNGVYAVIRILCACNSLLIYFVGGKWEVTQKVLFTSAGPNPKQLMVFQRGKHLVELGGLQDLGFDHFVALGYSFVPFTFKERLSIPGYTIFTHLGTLFGASLPPGPSLAINTIFLIIAISFSLGLPFLGLHRPSNWIFDSGLGAHIGRALGCIILQPFIAYWISSVWEIAMIQKGEAGDTWQWYDPWSDVLFVY